MSIVLKSNNLLSGRMKIQSIHAGHFACDGGALFGVIPKNLWQKVYPADENNVTSLTLRCLLVETETHKILIETGVGEHYPDKFIRNNGLRDLGILEQSLAEKGISPDDITDVLFTHLHWDHCNGAVKNVDDQLQLTFPNARHWCSKRQFDHSKISNPRERAAYSSLLIDFIAENGKLQLIENEREILPGIFVRMYDGHTPGQMIPFIQYKEKTVVYMADLIPTAAHVPLLWLAAYDLFPVTAMEEKEQFLNEAATHNYLLFFEHDLHTECVRVQKEGKVFRATEHSRLIDCI